MSADLDTYDWPCCGCAAPVPFRVDLSDQIAAARREFGDWGDPAG